MILCLTLSFDIKFFKQENKLWLEEEQVSLEVCFLTQHHLSACVKLFVKKIYKFNFNEIFNQINMDCEWFKGIKRRKLLLEE